MTLRIQNKPIGPDYEALYRRSRVEIKELRARVRTEIRRADVAEDLRSSLFQLRDADLKPPRWTQKRAARRSGSTLHVPILFTSDKQFGEVIRRGEMDGMNEFNAAIFAERYDAMIGKTIKWADAIERGFGATYDNGIIYLRGGDEISGDIHEELRETNDFGAVPAVKELVEYEREGAIRLRNRFGKVHIISIPGNHGRNTIKPHAKRYVATNYETIISLWLADSLRNEPGITCEVPESGYARFTAAGWRFELRHGDRMGSGGGVGWIGAPAPITKGHKKIRLDAATVDAPVDFVLTGHYHTSMKLPRGFGNGSFPGYNEYARQLGLDPDAAKQWLIFAHTQHVYGIELELSDFPRIGMLNR